MTAAVAAAGVVPPVAGVPAGVGIVDIITIPVICDGAGAADAPTSNRWADKHEARGGDGDLPEQRIARDENK